VSFLPATYPKLVLLVVSCVLLPLITIGGCGGNEFQDGQGAAAGGTQAAGGTSAAGKAGGAGVGTGGGIACGGPEDCDDADECTRDRCNADGTCDTSPLCTGNEKCCPGGECAECCQASDCDDHVDCTKNTCFAGQCMYVPDDSGCDPTQYCSTKDGCRAKQVCGLLDNEDVSKVCDDGSPCTGDSCVGNFCQHAFCATGSEQGGLCCPDKGCAKQCCTDSQCQGDDPCLVGQCGADGMCTQVQLCPGDQQCCPSADSKTATCGTCCSAADCDDKLGCTDDKCGGGQCTSTPDDSRCDDGYFCDPTPGKGCQKAPTCTDASSCVPPGPCQSNPSCSNGQCEFDNCSLGTKCCTTGCGVCCEDKECDDGIACTTDTCSSNGCVNTPEDASCGGGKCAPERGGCIECRDHADCDDASACTTDTCSDDTKTCQHVSVCKPGQYCYSGQCAQCQVDSDCQGGALQKAEPNIAAGCQVAKCVKGTCQTTSVTCTGLQMCCPPFGCAIHCAVLE
jgi:hypothetical protein